MPDKGRVKLIAEKFGHRVGGFLSVLGLINILDDLSSWNRAFNYLIEKASSIGLEDLLSYVALLIHTTSTYWHLLLHPIFDFFTSWLPFEIPLQFKDIIIVASFVILGKRRAFRVFTKSLDKERQIISKITHKYLKNSNELFLDFSISEAKSFILMKNAEIDILEPYEIHMIEKFKRCFGEDAENFSYDVLTSPEVLKIHKQHMSALNLSEKLEALVYFLAVVVVVFLIFDYALLLQHCK